MKNSAPKRPTLALGYRQTHIPQSCSKNAQWPDYGLISTQCVEHYFLDSRKAFCIFALYFLSFLDCYCIPGDCTYCTIKKAHISFRQFSNKAASYADAILVVCVWMISTDFISNECVWRWDSGSMLLLRYVLISELTNGLVPKTFWF